MANDDDEKIMGRMLGEQDEPEMAESLPMRLLHMLVIALMISLSQTILWAATILQIVLMVLNKRPNQRLADFGTDLGIWIAKAVRYQTGGSEVKPWPWTELD